MTENEVIEKLSGLRYKIRHDSFCNKVYSSELEALVIAEKALEALEKVKRYRAIGTIEECREAMEKQRGKKEVLESYCGFDSYECPVCGADVNCRNKYCHRCGQKLEVQS